MSTHTDELLQKHNLTPDAIHLPAGGVAVFGRTGNGKSSLFYGSKFLDRIIIADTGSTSHKLYATDPSRVVEIDPLEALSPIEQVLRLIREAKGPSLLDSWSTLQELEVLHFKRTNASRVKYGVLSIPQHGEIVGRLRDLALILARAPVFTVFNTTAGGASKTPSGEVVHYPAGALTGYQSLNGTEPNKETILARWPSVWGMFAGWPKNEIPRGLYVPANDIRPEGHEKYAPLKDPLFLIRDTCGKGIMAVPDRTDPKNADRCFVDELLVEASAKFPKKKPAPPAKK